MQRIQLRKSLKDKLISYQNEQSFQLESKTLQQHQDQDQIDNQNPQNHSSILKFFEKTKSDGLQNWLYQQPQTIHHHPHHHQHLVIPTKRCLTRQGIFTMNKTCKAKRKSLSQMALSKKTKTIDYQIIKTSTMNQDHHQQQERQKMCFFNNNNNNNVKNKNLHQSQQQPQQQSQQQSQQSQQHQSKTTKLEKIIINCNNTKLFEIQKQKQQQQQQHQKSQRNIRSAYTQTQQKPQPQHRERGKSNDFVVIKKKSSQPQPQHQYQQLIYSQQRPFTARPSPSSKQTINHQQTLKQFYTPYHHRQTTKGYIINDFRPRIKAKQIEDNVRVMSTIMKKKIVNLTGNQVIEYVQKIGAAKKYYVPKQGIDLKVRQNLKLKTIQPQSTNKHNKIMNLKKLKNVKRQ